MMKWLTLAIGAVLLFNGSVARTYGFPNQRSPKYCWQNDYFNIYGCFSSPIMPDLIVWSSLALGAFIVLGCAIYARR